MSVPMVSTSAHSAHRPILAAPRPPLIGPRRADIDPKGHSVFFLKAALQD